MTRIRRGEAGYKRWEKVNRPPDGEPWVWLTREMMESPAWQALTAPARRILDRIIIEHMHHGGTMNGDLIVTYDDFESYGVTRRSIRPALEVLVKLGWVDVTSRGQRSHGAAKRPSRYSLTWLPSNDGSPATNRWKGIKTNGRAKALVDGQKKRKLEPPGPVALLQLER